MSENTTNGAGKEVALESVITTAIKLPGVKVDRKKFLMEMFENEGVVIQDILDAGPIAANVSKEKLYILANKHILKRTSASSIASFIAGMPGGLAVAATIPIDVLQFFGMALRLAQELSYLYGADDLWQGRELDDEKVTNQFLLYFGVMFGVSGAVSGVRVLTFQIAKTTAKKLPQKALTKTLWFTVAKKLGKAIGVKVTKTTVTQSVTKIIPVIGGIVSGAINFASMMPMAKRLQRTLESATFEYTAEEYEKDIRRMKKMAEDAEIEFDQDSGNKDVKKKFSEVKKKTVDNIKGVFKNKKSTKKENEDVFETLKKLSELKDSGVITQEEFDAKKAELLSRI